MLKKVDPEVAAAILEETKRQAGKLELIPSENFVDEAVLEAQGCIMTNKYAEGYPGKRYYGGCEFVDQVDELARERAKKLFGAEHANVQPHSGAQANTAVYFALLNPGDTIMGMSLSNGGHLTHGSPVNLSGKYFNVVPYNVDAETERLDYAEVRKVANECRPKMIVAGASAYARAIDFQKFREICDEVGAYLMVDMAHIAGLVAAGLHPNPVPYCEFVTTTTHKTLRGPRGGMVLCQAKFAQDIDRQVFPGVQGGPLMHVVAAKKEAMIPQFRAYQRQVVRNCKELAKDLAQKGFRIVSGGTDNHLMLVDLSEKGVTGSDASNILGQINITVNKNLIPFDKKGAGVTSGVRIGTAAVTTRGLEEFHMRKIAQFINAAIEASDDPKKLEAVKKEVLSLAGKFPLYPQLVKEK